MVTIGCRHIDTIGIEVPGGASSSNKEFTLSEITVLIALKVLFPGLVQAVGIYLNIRANRQIFQVNRLGRRGWRNQCFITIFHIYLPII